jgi:putative DNA methylase
LTHPIKAPRKLIEVALPLDDINEQAAREKSIRHGHPSTLHLWWARRPLAAARAVIFAQLVNDPSWKWELENPGVAPPAHLKGGWANARRHLFALISELVKWENTNNEELLEKARAEIRKSWRETCEVNRDHPEAATLFNPDKLPGLHDPFAGGGTIPLEAQRLGLEAFASDLNPVAVLINKAMIEIPPKFAGRPPVHPEALQDPENYGRVWKGAQGLAEDVRRYGAWMRAEAEKRIGHLYPKVKVTAELAADRPDLQGLVGQELTVIAWLWARTVKSPNPAFSHVDVPLVSSFVLASKEGKEAWVEPVVEGDRYRFEVRTGRPTDLETTKAGTGAGKWAGFRCLLSDTPIGYSYIRDEGTGGRMGTRLLAVVAEGHRGRVYFSPSDEMEGTAQEATPTWRPDLPINYHPRDIKTQIYGLTTYADLFTHRQLVALTTFSDLVGEARERAHQDAITAGLSDDSIGLEHGGRAAMAYGEAVGTYLSFSVSKAADRNTSLCVWEPQMSRMRGTFGRQALPMVWDYVETNPLAGAGGDIYGTAHSLAEVLDKLLSATPGQVFQRDAQSQSISLARFVSTDPPYYDNIGYADLSDFFYVWLRRSLRSVFPSLFTTIAVPKAEELVATPYRHGSKEKAEQFFLDGMTEVMRRLAQQAHPAGPVTIYYAFKQTETNKNTGTSSTGWETFLESVLRAGFALTGTWPMRTELSSRTMGTGYNSLASSIVLVCRRRPADAPTASRREFLRELDAVLPVALDAMTRGTEGAQHASPQWGVAPAGSEATRSPVAPVDLSQAIIGPGMAVFSRYAAVLEANGEPMSVKTALQLINRFLAEDDFDAGTQFCLRWFEQHGWGEGAFGEADVLARAKATSVAGLDEAGVLFSGAGKVRLRRASEYPEDWDPTSDTRLPVWEALHQLVRVFRKDGEQGAGRLLSAVRSKTEAIRQLAYRLYTLCERLGHADDARGYNELVAAWSGVETVASAAPEPKAKSNQLTFGFEEKP